MAIPLSNTHIAIDRVPPDPNANPQADGYAPPTEAQVPVRIAKGVRAILTAPSATTRLTGGTRVVWASTLTCDPCDLQTNDTVTEDSGRKWTVLWATPVKGFGLSHMTASLRMVEGASA